MTIDLVIAVAKRVPVILNQRRRYGWIAEVRMAAGFRRCSLGNVTLGCFETIMVTLLCDLSSGRGRWRRVIRRRLWMRTSRKSKRKQQCCNREKSLHDRPSYQPEAI
jgi:hypothetical protein